MPTFSECGCCGHFHPIGFTGDCRDDANRFTAEQLTARYGEDGWDYLDIDHPDNQF